MSDSTDVLIQIPLDDGRTVIARPQGWRYGQADGGRDILLSAADGDFDTAGHGESTDVLVDVEGHAMTLHLPTTADAAALRRALVAGAVTATIVAAGAVAAMQTPPPQAGTGIEEPRPGTVQEIPRSRYGPIPE